MSEHKVSEAKRRNNKKWDDQNTGQIGIKAKKGDVDKCKEYANQLGITPSKFAMKAMLYCIEHNITFDNKEN